MPAVDTDEYTSLYTTTKTASSHAYQEIKTMLLLGDVPIGARLREERLAERLDMSRTPVREALLRLYAENFVERHAEGGYKATTPSSQMMRELYDVRRALELYSLQRTYSDQPRDQESLLELRFEWRALEAEAPTRDAEFVHIDEDFHCRLAESAGNQQMAAELRRLNERIRPIRSHDFLSAGRIAATIEQHLEIVDAVVAHRMTKAQQLLDHHISGSQAVVEQAVANVLERMLSVAERDSSW